MALPVKMVACTCGNSFEIQERKDWCDRCGRPVFYNPKDRVRNRLHTGYAVLMLALGIGFFTYLFMEMVVRNFFSRP